jgi:hypothetical protein
MDNPADTLDQTDEDILTYTVSDAVLKAAADTEKNPVATIVSVPVEAANMPPRAALERIGA